MHLMVISHQDDSYRADFRFERIDLPKLANGGERVVRLVSVSLQENNCNYLQPALSGFDVVTSTVNFVNYYEVL